MNDPDSPEAEIKDKDYSINVQDMSHMHSLPDQSMNQSPQKPNKFGVNNSGYMAETESKIDFHSFL